MISFSDNHSQFLLYPLWNPVSHRLFEGISEIKRDILKQLAVGFTRGGRKSGKRIATGSPKIQLKQSHPLRHITKTNGERCEWGTAIKPNDSVEHKWDFHMPSMTASIGLPPPPPAPSAPVRLFTGRQWESQLKNFARACVAGENGAVFYRAEGMGKDLRSPPPGIPATDKNPIRRPISQITPCSWEIYRRVSKARAFSLILSWTICIHVFVRTCIRIITLMKQKFHLSHSHIHTHTYRYIY